MPPIRGRVQPRALSSLGVLGLSLALACAPAVAPPAPTAAPAPAPEGPPIEAAAPISAQEYASRRAALAESMADGLLLVLGAPQPAADYLPYQQRSDFRYLTGIVEPSTALLIEKRAGQVEELLFVLPRDPARETWEGHRHGPAGATDLTGMPAATIDRLIPELQQRLTRSPALYLVGGRPPAPAPGRVLDPEQQLVGPLLERYPHLSVRDIRPAIAQLRASKSPTEIDLLRRAIHITVLAHREAMRATQPGLNEFEIQALIEYTFRRHGADEPGFASIVASGPNSTTLHYRAANRFMDAGEVLLLDVGARYRGYTADVTRTIPVDGAFGPRQREIYQIVLDAQKAAEALVRPGATWDQLNDAAERVIADGLAELGLIDAPDATYRCESPRFGMVCPQYRLYYMHGLGHGIGLDVHDPDASRFGLFVPGSIFTIEPGIYVRADALDHLPDTPENRAMAQRIRPSFDRYVNIGVRLEDDYLVTDGGYERLTAGAPREIDEVETLMREPARTGAARNPGIVEWYRATEWHP
jgi:Xaa-Pro aminopeptidase